MCTARNASVGRLLSFLPLDRERREPNEPSGKREQETGRVCSRLSLLSRERSGQAGSGRNEAKKLSRVSRGGELASSRTSLGYDGNMSEAAKVEQRLTFRPTIG